MKLIVFTDLDATLLDVHTYSWQPAVPALNALKMAHAVIVLVSSKTLAEMEPLYDELGLVGPFVVENGGGIVVKDGDEIAAHLRRELPSADVMRWGDRLVMSLGTEYTQLVEDLAEISSEIGMELVGFSDMSAEKIAELTGLNPAEAEKARMRLFDEPFVVPEATLSGETKILRAAEARGLTAVRGGRFFHLIGHAGKGKAVALLIDAFRSLYGKVHTVGLGDSPNDYPFLELVDTPVLVGGAGCMSDLTEAPASALRTEASGPEGWNEAILRILADRNL